ncbi:hypothetical protein POV27_08285 [Aureisphaera galaxeae]|uniref:hypothetical protein n=1 Tax=Aureisphaera galaxeae TaxID=1538023 RepID=UPI002350C891|nr:hypothetical protein [Aureisphaera galaxeae]MDC8004048.1 hypothetical protein [Aureisphaera galaxeae]
MKRFALLLTFCLVISSSLYGQAKVGVRGGVNLTFFNENQEQFGLNADAEVGYFGGIFVDVTISEQFHIQPEALYAGVGEFEFINAPIYAKYYVADSVSLAVGPSLNYFFDFFINKLKVRADISAAYHFSESVETNLKYTLGFEELSPNVLFLGVGIKL